jgi:hypothetical protein
MYLAQEVGGYRGVLALHAVGMFALAFLVARSVRRVSGPLLACVITGLSLLGLFLGSAERPQLLSWCLLAASVPALHRAVDRRTAPWWFIAVIWLWANLHGLWVGALMLYAALVLGLVIEVGPRAWRTYRSFVAVGAASAAVTMLTPVGPRHLLTPLHVREYAPYVGEWGPPSILNHFFAPAFVLLAILAVGWARNPVPVRPPVLCLMIAACYLGFSYTRTIPVAVIVLAPMAGSAWSPSVECDDNPPRNEVRMLVASAIALATVAALLLPQLPGVQRGAPWAASRALDDLPGRASVLNEYDLGGWLLWTARDTAPGIDGRTEIYSTDYVGGYLAALQLQDGWQRFVESHRFDAAWLRTSTPLAGGLKSEGWIEVYHNDFSTRLVSPAAAPCGRLTD